MDRSPAQNWVWVQLVPAGTLPLLVGELNVH
jgi:hypothetical protein